MRKAVLLILVASFPAFAVVNPHALFEPHWTYADSFSQRISQPRPFSNPRFDWIVDQKDGTGHPLLVEVRQPDDTTADSVVFHLEWSQEIPVADVPSFGTPTRTVEEIFLNGQEKEIDTGLSSWDPISRTLIRTETTQPSGCVWKDSSNFDAQNRLVFQMECIGQGDAYIYRAWFENPTDSLPRRSSMNEPSLAPYALWDSVYATGNPNRPDTLLGSEPDVLVRDGAGRVVALNPSGQSGDSSTYAYDSQGRLVLLRTFPGSYSSWDTTAYLYSWNDAAGLLPPGVRMSGARIVGRDLELDLPAPDRVRADLLGLDGKLLSTIADRILPEGRTLVPISTRTGELVRIRSSNGESILRIPPRFQ
jgi:hypothetical protein